MAVKKKEARVALLMTEAQKARWESYADAKDISLSSFIRNCVEAYINAYDRMQRKEGNGK